MCDDYGWYCVLCNEEIPRNVVVYRLKCSKRCRKLFHIKCLGISTEDYFVIKKSGSEWYCGECDEPVPNDEAEEDEDSNDVLDSVDITEAIKIESINLCLEENGQSHHTERFELMRRDESSEEPAMLVVRRGQPFKLKLMCNRPFNPDIDDMALTFSVADAENPTHGNGTLAGVAVREDTNDLGESNHWASAVESLNENEIEIIIRPAVTASVTKWKLMVETRLFTGHTESYNYPNELFILFNPWFKDDVVYVEDESLLDEYIMEDTTLIWRGSYNRMRRTVWKFGHFEKNVLDAALIVISGPGQIAASNRGDPVKVTRALSAAVNSVDDDGVVFGNWSEHFPDGKAPTEWIGSAEILQQYLETRKPVNYGQCWVFAGVLSTICKAVGIPTRIVTNYSSAHDTHGSLTVDYFIGDNGVVMEDMNTDSIWNYHVWNEVWMARPDLQGQGEESDYGGWQAVDATPQETSEGIYRCGPASVKAVRIGEINLGFDTNFLYSEVNADKVYWKYSGPTNPHKLLKKDTLAIGQLISTKAIGSFEREDITDSYKFAENTSSERLTMLKALQQTNTALSKFYLNEEFNDVYFNFELLDDIVIGNTFNVTLHVTNRSPDKTFTINGTLNVEAIQYTGRNRNLVKSSSFDKTMEPSTQEIIQLEVTFDEYFSLLSDQAAFNISCFATVLDTGYEFFAQDDFRVRNPDIRIQFYSEPILNEICEGVVCFENPLPMPLTNCFFIIEGPGLDKPIRAEPESENTSGSPVSAYFQYKPIYAGELSLIAKFISTELKDVDGFFKFSVK